MEINEILSRVTVDCKDNGHNFTVTNRLQVIEELLENTEYKLIHNGRLCRIYGKKPVRNQPVILISSHVDCVYDRLFCEEVKGGIMKGTFDNSLTNACVLYDMIQGNLNENVVVAFTGDEEEDSGGAYEVMRVMRQWYVQIALAIVLDITEEGWKEQYHFTVENDLGIDIMTAHRIVSLLEKYESVYGYTHDAEPDESYDYDEEDIACFTLCIPTYGDMHGEKGVLARANLLPTYCTVLAELANMDYHTAIKIIMYNREYTPERISELRENEIFVFGSNLAGSHGGGAARLAYSRFGAVWGQGVGLQGRSYAIPTMQGGVETIRPYVDDFIEFAQKHSDLTFYVTRIGCGIAGFQDEYIAPLFDKAFDVENIILPKTFVEIINHARRLSSETSGLEFHVQPIDFFQKTSKRWKE